MRGSAAGTRDLAPCLPGHVVERVHAIFLSGGSAFGLDAAAGVMEYLESRGVGFPAGKVRVPIVPGAVIFDLHLGSSRARPDRRMALQACRKASREVVEGSVGAGTGATVGKLFGIGRATKGGLGFGQPGIAGRCSRAGACGGECLWRCRRSQDRQSDCRSARVARFRRIRGNCGKHVRRAGPDKASELPTRHWWSS